MTYELVGPDGEIKVTSSMPYLGYNLEILRDMEKAGYKLQIDGRRAKFPTEAQWRSACQQEKRD